MMFEKDKKIIIHLQHYKNKGKQDNAIFLNSCFCGKKNYIS